MFADLEIVVNGESLKAYKCILTARSEKFNVMLTSEATQEMEEHRSGKINLQNKDVTPEIYKEMLRWLYMGECEISHNPKEVLPLLQLTDEYLLPDL